MGPALGFAPGPFVSLIGAPAVTSGVNVAAGVTATAGASGAKLAALLAKFDADNSALPCPERSVGVVR